MKQEGETYLSSRAEVGDRQSQTEALLKEHHEFKGSAKVSVTPLWNHPPPQLLLDCVVSIKPQFFVGFCLRNDCPAVRACQCSSLSSGHAVLSRSLLCVCASAFPATSNDRHYFIQRFPLLFRFWQIIINDVFFQRPTMFVLPCRKFRSFSPHQSGRYVAQYWSVLVYCL